MVDLPDRVVAMMDLPDKVVAMMDLLDKVLDLPDTVWIDWSAETLNQQILLEHSN
jgi:hypothetical protein